MWVQEPRICASVALLLLHLGFVRVVHADESSLSLQSHAADDRSFLSFDFSLLNGTALPKPLSDLTANLYGENVYLAGGCDAEDGNVYSDTIGEFICGSASSSLYAFNYRTSAVRELASMPVPRYRHAAVAVNGRLWLVGGRTVEDDSIIGQVDVYDMSDDTWRSFELPTRYYSSDLTGFPHDDMAFFAGGYDSTYSTFLSTVFAINTTASLLSDTSPNSSNSSSSLVILDKAPLLVGRGDTASVTNDDGQYALVTGGFGPTQQFCAPERAVDFYHFDNDTWTSVTPVPIGRSDNALVELNGLVFSIGGERQIDNICNLTDADKPEPGEQTIPVDDVVVFDWSYRNWTIMPDRLPQHRFRMAAVAVDALNTVYTFGGQTSYDSSCQCFRTSTDIFVYKEVEIGSNVATSDGSAETSASVGSPALLWWPFVLPGILGVVGLA